MLGHCRRHLCKQHHFGWEMDEWLDLPLRHKAITETTRSIYTCVPAGEIHLRHWSGGIVASRRHILFSIHIVTSCCSSSWRNWPENEYTSWIIYTRIKIKKPFIRLLVIAHNLCGLLTIHLISYGSRIAIFDAPLLRPSYVYCIWKPIAYPKKKNVYTYIFTKNGAAAVCCSQTGLLFRPSSSILCHSQKPLSSP